MTKLVRIENADTSDHVVIVEVWNKGSDNTPDVREQVIELSFPTAMSTLTIWRDRYLVIKEREKAND